MVINEIRRIPITQEEFLNVYELACLHGQLNYLMQKYNDINNPEITALRNCFKEIGNFIRRKLDITNAFYIDRLKMEFVIFDIEYENLPENNQVKHSENYKTYWIEIYWDKRLFYNMFILRLKFKEELENGNI